MRRRSHLSPVIALSVLLPAAFASAALAQRPIFVPGIIQLDEASIRLRALAQAWAWDLGVRSGLSSASCSPSLDPGSSTGCGFEMDGIRVSMSKKGTAPTAVPRVDLDIGPIIDVGGGVPYATSGGWIKAGDKFEVQAGKIRQAFTCGPAGEGLEVVACRKRHPDSPAGETPEQYSRRFEALRQAAGLEVGRAFLDGTIQILHNGRPVDIKPLGEAVRAFARRDFGHPTGERK